MSKKIGKPQKYLQQGPKNLVVMVVVGVLILAVISYFTSDVKKELVFSYKTFIDSVERGAVKKVIIRGQDAVGEQTDGAFFRTTLPDGDKDVWPLLKQKNVDIVIEQQAAAFGGWNIVMFMFMSFFIMLFLWFIYRQSRGGVGGGSGGAGGGLFNLGKSRAKMFLPSMMKEKFDSVAGAQEAKEDLKDVVDYLKNPEKFNRLGAKMTRGVLMVGEPGTGKTLLARAVAGEANCPFFSISGSDFIEVFVGVGAARVRDLFEQARQKAPSIVFIDEIDAVGRHRGSGLGGGNDEREQTLNQLLTEMDGFDTNKAPVIVIAATNRQDILDKALLRPGRFDRIVHMPLPDLKSREQILAVHAKTITMDPAVDLKIIARGTPWFSGADLANLINEAAINASKEGRSKVTIEDFEYARDKMLLGKERKTLTLTEQDKKETAYHEAGHAMITLLNPEVCDPLHKVTIIPRGRALGVTHSLPIREKYLITKKEMLGNIMMSLGGRIAEELVFGKMSTGASSDFMYASGLARDMVTKYGMSDDVGLVVYGQNQTDFPYSQKTAEKIDAAVEKLISTSYEQAKELLLSNIDMLHKLATELINKETLYAAEVYALLGIEPRENLRWTESSENTSDDDSQKKADL
jgi:cell division protease FtsH